jgi:hypothetical protein
MRQEFYRVHVDRQEAVAEKARSVRTRWRDPARRSRRLAIAPRTLDSWRRSRTMDREWLEESTGS